MRIELDERYLRVLNVVIENFINYKETAGSRILIKRYNLSFSAATMRNIMSDLEEMGYLKHSYISSGKIPTEKGYKLYVNYLIENKKISSNIKLRQLDNININTMSDLMIDASDILSNFSGLVSVVSMPNIFMLNLKEISFVKISSNKLLCIIIVEPSIVETKIIDMVKNYEQEALNDFAQFLQENYKGWSLERIRQDLKNSILDSKLECEYIFNKLKEKSRDLYLSGVQNLIKDREFYENYEQLNGILDVIEKKKYIAEIIDTILQKGENILIGTDIPNAKLKNMSLIVQPYCVDKTKLGVVGVLGPMNIDYGNIISTLDFLSKKIERMLRKWR